MTQLSMDQPRPEAIMPYTVSDTPELVARIDADLADVVATVRKGDPRLRSLVLTGGFARGEGMVLDGAPQNDYDFVAIRSPGRPHTNYAVMRAELEARLGIHIDLAPVPAWRLRCAPRTVFWYETALRGRVLWGESLLPSIRVRSASGLARTEGLRLLVNRAAGLLLVSESRDGHAVRIQAAKAILASFDSHMLAAGHFAPSQTERWHAFQDLRALALAPPALMQQQAWLEWAYRFKVDPASAPPRNHEEAWHAARRAILDAVPAALRHAGLKSLEMYGRMDGALDQVVYALRAGSLAGARRFVLNPTGTVRMATLLLLEAARDGRVRHRDARRCFSGIARVDSHPLRTLEGLRAATLQ